MGNGTDNTGRKERWYDASRVIWGLFGFITLVILSSVGVLWAAVETNRKANAAQDVKIQKIETTLELEIKGIRTEQSAQRVMLEEALKNR